MITKGIAIPTKVCFWEKGERNRHISRKKKRKLPDLHHSFYAVILSVAKIRHFAI
jgi:hypothetical protein